MSEYARAALIAYYLVADNSLSLVMHGRLLSLRLQKANRQERKDAQGNVSRSDG